MVRHDILIEDTGERFPCAETRTLLEGMTALGRRGIPVGCRNGGCGVCKVAILEGEWEARVMSREHVSEEDERRGHVLACRVRPLSGMRLQAIGPLKKSLAR